MLPSLTFCKLEAPNLVWARYLLKYQNSQAAGVRSSTSHVLTGVVFLVTNINTFVWWWAGWLAGCVCVCLTVQCERSSVAACLGHMIYDLNSASRKTEFEKGLNTTLQLSATSSNRRSEEMLSITHEDDEMCEIKAGGGACDGGMEVSS